MRIMLVVMLCVFANSMAFGNLTTYYEDDFSGETLNPSWQPLGAGAYNLVDGDLEFATVAGDFVDDYESYWGAPQHAYVVALPSFVTEFSAITRVRYNTPYDQYHQVDILAYQDNDTYVKNGYQMGGTYLTHTWLSEYPGTYSEDEVFAETQTDYFWLRIDWDSETLTYDTYFSASMTADPDEVNWTALGALYNPMPYPMIGIGGWNGAAEFGPLAEFDYFRVQIVPEPASIAALAALLAICARRR